jgi:7,8-dihydroneopterin aldolase/epimerase/oxygenase
VFCEEGDGYMDKILLNRMSFYGYHGVLKEENKIGQRFYVDLELETDLKPAGVSDDLEKTVNYAKVYKLTEGIVEGKAYNLVETICEKIAQTILDEFAMIQSCKVKVIKPDPPIDGHYDSVAIEITRTRP